MGVKEREMKNISLETTLSKGKLEVNNENK